MEWAKTRSAARFNFANSRLTSVALPEFPWRVGEPEITDGGCGLLLDVAQYLGTQVRRVSRRFGDDFAMSLGEMKMAITPRTRLIVLTNLHNPTGALIPIETLRVRSASWRNGSGRASWSTKLISRCCSRLFHRPPFR